jgi:hypothetical protein
VSLFMLTLVIPTLLSTAYELKSLHLFSVTPEVQADYNLLTWLTVVAMDTLGPVKLVFDYFDLSQLIEIGELSERFSAPWQWFMALVQVALISLVFDVFRRYLDLNSTLDRFASTILISAEQLLHKERELHEHLTSSHVDQHLRHQLTHEHQAAQNDLHARVDTLARFLTVFSRRRMMNTLIKTIDRAERHPFSVEATDEGRGQLLLALMIAGARSGSMSLAARISQQSALRSLHVNVPVPIRLAALDTLGSYHQLLHPKITLKLASRDQSQALMLAREQLMLGSAHSVSVDLSIEYERLTLASAFVLAFHGERGAAASLLMLRLSKSQILKREGEQRLHHLLGRQDHEDKVLLEQVARTIEASEHHDDALTSTCISGLIDLLTPSLDTSDMSVTPHDEASTNDRLLEVKRELDLDLGQLLISTLVDQVKSPRVIRSAIERLSRVEIKPLGLILWATLQRSSHHAPVIAGLIEGIQSSGSLTREVTEHIIQTLRFGSPYEVRYNQILSMRFTDPDSLTVPQIFMDEIDRLALESSSYKDQSAERSSLEGQLYNLLGGLSLINVSGHAEKVNAWLDQATWTDTTVNIQACVDLLRAMAGDSSRFHRLFSEYLESLTTSSNDRSPKQVAYYNLIHLVDPSLSKVEDQWLALLNESRAGKIGEANQRAIEVITEVQRNTTPVRVAWLWTLLGTDQHQSLRSPLIQRLCTRAKHINQTKLIPFTHKSAHDWMRSEVMRRCQIEDNQVVMAQWLKLLGVLGSESELDEQAEVIHLLYQALDGNLSLTQASVRKVAAESIGRIGQNHQVEASTELVKRFTAITSQTAQAGIARALNMIGDQVAFDFFAQKATELDVFNEDGFIAMVKTLHSARDYRALSSVLLRADMLSDRKLSELLKPFGTSELPALSLREYLSEQAISATRDLVLNKINDPDTNDNVVASCVGVIPQIVLSEDQLLCDALINAVQDSELRQGNCQRITHALSLTFPAQFLEWFTSVLDSIPQDNKPKWIAGLAPHDPDQSVMLLLKLADDARHNQKPINMNNISTMTGVLLKHGGSLGRRAVYQWLVDYPHIAYAIVKRIASDGSREQDRPRLKDELYRNQLDIERLRTLSSSKERDDQLRAAAQLQVEVLNALYSFGEDKSFVDMLSLVVSQPEDYADQVLKYQARLLIPGPIKNFLSTADLEDDVGII